VHSVSVHGWFHVHHKTANAGAVTLLTASVAGAYHCTLLTESAQSNSGTDSWSAL
jgi:hypothetical protein